jgi:5-methylthioribose kinase
MKKDVMNIIRNLAINKISEHEVINKEETRDTEIEKFMSEIKEILNKMEELSTELWRSKFLSGDEKMEIFISYLRIINSLEFVLKKWGIMKSE